MITSFDDPQLEKFREEVRAWATDALPPDWRTREIESSEDELVGIRRDWDRALFDAGFVGLGWPAEIRGEEPEPLLDFVLHEELARAHAPEGYGRIGRTIVAPLLIAHGTADQRERFLPGVLDGSRIWCLGLSEPDAGSDLAALRTLATRAADGYRVNGRKIWTSHAHNADFCLLLTRTSTELPRHRNLSYLLVDLRSPGIEITPIITAVGDHHFNEVAFTDVEVPEAGRLGEENQGWAIFRDSLRHERGSGVALNHVIDMSRAADVALACCAPTAGPAQVERAEHLRDRIELLRWHIMRTLETEVGGDDATGPAVVVQLTWSELWQEITAHGERVTCARHRAFWFRERLRSRAGTIYGGTSEIQRDTIARTILGRLA